MKKNLIVLALVGFLLYLPSLRGPFLWDDEDFVYANKYVQNFQIDKFFTESQTAGRGKISNYFRPVPQIVYASIHSVFGFNPFWYHLVNILVHIGAACAIYYFFLLLLNQGNGVGNFSQSEGKLFGHMVPNKAAEDEKKLPSRFPTYIPLLISLFFLIHPIQTEAISYISGLSDPLFVLFGFLSLIFFLKNRLLTSLLFFLFSLLSKETGIVFLGLISVIQFLFIGSKSKNKSLFSNLSSLLPFILTSLIYLWYHFTFINQLNMASVWGNNIYANSLPVRLLTFIQNLYLYIGLLIFPKDLFMERDFSLSIQTNFFNPYLLGFIIFIGLMIFFFHRLSAARYPLSALVFCFLGFFISFLPYTGIVLINGIFYEHFLYLPMVFFFAFLIFLAKSLGTEHRNSLKRFPWISVCVLWILVAILVIFSIRNIFRQLDWTDPVRFYSQTLSHAPQSIRIINGLGMAYADRDDNNLAIEQYNKAITLDPHVPNLYHNLANVYIASGDIKSAEENYLKAIAADPKFIFSWQSLANLYQQTGQTDKLNQLISNYQKQYNIK